MRRSAQNRAFKVGPFRLAPHKRNGKPSGGWLVNIPATLAGGRRMRKFFDNCIDARHFARRLEQHYRRGTWDLSSPDNAIDNPLDNPADNPGPKPKRRPSRARKAGTDGVDKPLTTFAEAVDRWLVFQKLRVDTGKKKPGTLAGNRYRLRILASRFGAMALGDITEERILGFQAMRLRQGRRPATVNTDIRTLTMVLRWAHRKGLVAALPVVEKIPEPPVDAPVPTRAEVRRIVDNLPDRLKPLVRFIAQTGCRSGEAFNLTWDRLDLDNNSVEIRPCGGWTPKTRSSIRRIPIPPDLAAELGRLPRKGPYVFPGKRKGRPLDNIKRAFETAVRAAAIERNGQPIRITVHTLRKAVATWLAVDDGVPQRVLQSILGHAPGSAVTDRYYVSASEEAKRRAVSGLGW